MDRWMDGWMDGWMDRWMELKLLGLISGAPKSSITIVLYVLAQRRIQ